MEWICFYSGTTWRAIASPLNMSSLIEERSDWDKFLFTYIRNSDGNADIAGLVVGITWVPAVLVFFIDAQIVFTLFQMLFGVWDGINMRIGHVNTWGEFVRRLPKLAVLFEKRINATCSTAETSALAQAFTASKKQGVTRSGSASSVFGEDIVRVTALLPATSSQVMKTSSMQHFVDCWNCFIGKLRADDYLSDRELSLYKCLTLPGPSFPGFQAHCDPEHMFPALLTLDVIPHMLETIAKLEDRFRIEAAGIDADTDPSTRLLGMWQTHVLEFCRALNSGHICQGAKEALGWFRKLLKHLLRVVLGADGPHQLFVEFISDWSGRALTVPGRQWSDSLAISELPPFLTNVFWQPDNTAANKSQGVARRKAVLDAILNFAKAVTSVCYRDDGASKQGDALNFRRSQTGRGFQGQGTRDKVRGAIKQLLSSIAKLDPGIQGAIDSTLTAESGFFINDGYCESQLTKLAADSGANATAEYLRHILSTSRQHSEPRSVEARRRILFFSTSLHMDMPAPNLVEHMRSLSTLTPMCEYS
jgi:hypothetical protein